MHFSRFLRGVYFATKSMLQNSKFLQAAYIADYEIKENSNEISEFSSKFTSLGKYLIGLVFGCEKLIRKQWSSGGQNGILRWILRRILH